MKKLCWVLLVVCLLTGCGSRETFETLGNVSHIDPTTGALRRVTVSLPEGAILAVNQADAGFTVYDCTGYTLVLETMRSGDVQASIREVSGLDGRTMTVMQSHCADHDRYDWVWTAASEEGELVCRAAVLDDGKNHYALWAMVPSSLAGELQAEWNEVFASFCLENEE